LGKRRLFADETMHSRLATATRQLTGWSTGMYDFDSDGWKDLFSANSHFPKLGRYLGGDSGLPNSVFRNLGSNRFADVSVSVGKDFQGAALHHGAAFGDFDNNGRVDVVVSALNGLAKLFRNVTQGNNHWLGVRLVGARRNRQGLGAEVRVMLPDGSALYNQATTSVGYTCSSEPVVRFGLHSFEFTKQMEVKWPGRATPQSLTNIKANQWVTDTRGFQRVSGTVNFRPQRPFLHAGS
jgi:hypothetical protein